MKSIFHNITNRKISLFLKIVLIIVWIFPNYIYPQELYNDTFDNQSKWVLSLYLATTIGGPGKQIENVMRTSGFDDRSPGFFSSGGDHPKTRFGTIPWMIDAQYRMNKLVSVGLQISNSIQKRTHGYADPQGGLGHFLDLNYMAKTYATIISFYLNEYIILGIGPSINTLESYEMYGGYEINQIKENTIGILTHLNLRYHIISFLSGNLFFQYRYIGNTNIGPFVKEDTIGISTPTPSTVTITFPETEINYSHWFIGFGIGMHF